MKVAFLSRKNLVVLAIAALFAFNFIVVGLLLCNVPAFNDLIWSMGINIIEVSLINAADQAGLAITGVFIFVLVFAIIFIYRLGKINGRKFFSKKVIIPLVISVVVWIGVVLLINLLVEYFDFSLFADLFLIEGVSLVIALLASLVLAIPLGAIIVIIVNFVNMGRPYGFFEKELMPDFGDSDEDTNVSKSFGEVKEEVKVETPKVKESKPEGEEKE